MPVLALRLIALLTSRRVTDAAVREAIFLTMAEDRCELVNRRAAIRALQDTMLLHLIPRYIDTCREI